MSIPLNYHELYFTKSLKFSVGNLINLISLLFLDRILMFYYGIIFVFISISHFLKVM